MILEVKNLKVDFIQNKNITPIIKGVSFNVKENMCLGILGESGSGKSMTCKALMGLLDKNFSIKGEVLFKGKKILSMNEDEKRQIRGKSICMILQNPMTAFNPLYTIGNQVFETFREHIKISKRDAEALAIKSFEKMNLQNPSEILKKYPHELSGGMLQRIMIGLTIALEPDLIIADEPTTAIDCLNQVEVIKEFKRMREIFKTSMIFITHDLSVLAQLANEIIVMENGSIIESGSKEEIIYYSKEEHTKYLINTRLRLIDKFKQALV